MSLVNMKFYNQSINQSMEINDFVYCVESFFCLFVRSLIIHILDISETPQSKVVSL